MIDGIGEDGSHKNDKIHNDFLQRVVGEGMKLNLGIITLTKEVVSGGLRWDVEKNEGIMSSKKLNMNSQESSNQSEWNKSFIKRVTYNTSNSRVVVKG